MKIPQWAIKGLISAGFYQDLESRFFDQKSKFSFSFMKHVVISDHSKNAPKITFPNPAEINPFIAH
jgi:hypothetical protein